MAILAKTHKTNLCLLSLLLNTIFCSGQALSSPEEKDWLDSLNEQPKPAAPSAQEIQNKLLTESCKTEISHSSRRLRANADLHFKSGSLSQALAMIERSLELNPDDFDSRVAYANVLSKKLELEKPRKNSTYNLCVKQWFYIYKTAEFQEDSNNAAQHLKELTGEAPTLLSSTKRYLAKVLLPEDDNLQLNATTVATNTATGTESSKSNNSTLHVEPLQVP